MKDCWRSHELTPRERDLLAEVDRDLAVMEESHPPVDLDVSKEK